MSELKIGVGTSLGIVFGLLLGMLTNLILIPVGIACGVLYDQWKERDK